MLAGELIVNDLAAAALSLCPPIAGTLLAVEGAGADHALVCGSGPTVAGLFWGDDAQERAATAAAALAERFPGTASAMPVSAEFGLPRFA